MKDENQTPFELLDELALALMVYSDSHDEDFECWYALGEISEPDTEPPVSIVVTSKRGEAYLIADGSGGAWIVCIYAASEVPLVRACTPTLSLDTALELCLLTLSGPSKITRCTRRLN